MEIRILELIDGARRADGLTVIIDVLRAFSLEAYLFARGAGRIYAVGREETARDLKRLHPEYVLIGERGGVKLPGFDFGNSPSQTKRGDFAGKTVIHTTSAGTQGLANASGAAELLTGSLVNASAIAGYIRSRAPERVSLVAMGTAGETSGAEDLLCAEYIASLLGDPVRTPPPDPRKERYDLITRGYAARFFDPAWQDVFPEEDFWMCTETDLFDFVLRVTPKEEDIFEVNKCRAFRE